MKSLLSLCIGLFLFAAPLVSHQASAAVFWYEDDQGHMHYTNDPTTIPPKYHDSIVIEKEIQYLGPQPDETVGAEEEETTQGEKSPVEILQERERALMKEYQQLREEKKKLDQAQQAADTPEEILNNNEQIQKFNQKLKDYHQRKESFKKELEEFKAGGEEEEEENVQERQTGEE